MIHRKDLQPVVYVVGDVAGGPGKTDSPLYGMFAMRAALAQLTPPGGLPLREHWIAPPEDRFSEFGLKWDGEWQVTYETFRDMGIAYARRPDPDLPAGGGAVPLLPDAAGDHGADPADHHRRDARPRAVRRAVHGDLA